MSDITFLHGDSRDLLPELLVGQVVNCVVTDPPFGVAHVSNFAKVDTKNQVKIIDDEDPAKAIETFIAVMDIIIPRLAEEADLYVFTSWKVIEEWLPICGLLSPDIAVENVLVWEKGWPGLGDLDCNWPFSFELIIYMKKGRLPIKARRSSVLAFDKPVPAHQIHPTEKPVELLMELIKQSTQPGDLVVDPFAGSASTLVACERLGRNAIGCERDPEFFSRADERFTVQSLPLGL